MAPKQSKMASPAKVASGPAQKMRKISDSKAVLMMESSRAEQVHQYHIREAKEISKRVSSCSQLSSMISAVIEKYDKNSVASLSSTATSEMYAASLTSVWLKSCQWYLRSQMLP